MSDYRGGRSGGVGVGGVLAIVFIVLKLVHEIDWSWWWVLSPVWISAAFAALVLLILGAVLLVVRRYGSRARRPR
jgi:hypothetical protein